LITAPLRKPAPETGAGMLREPRGKEGARGAPFPVSHDLAAVLAVKAMPCGCAARSLDRSRPPRKRPSDMRGSGLIEWAITAIFRCSAGLYRSRLPATALHSDSGSMQSALSANEFVFSGGLAGPDWLRFIKSR
jgi:hypothetical protein